PEQRDQSYQFLAAQHFPLTAFWITRIVFWLTLAVLLAVVMLGGGALLLLIKSLAAVRSERFGPVAAPMATGRFEFGALQKILGPVLFFGVWLVYGFCVGQVFVLYCRKNILAVLLSTLVCLGLFALWLPSLLCRGMNGWHLWLPPLLLLAATRLLV